MNRVAVIFLWYIGWWVIWALSTREQMFTTQSAHQYLPTAALKLQISVVNACTGRPSLIHNLWDLTHVMY